jgi:DNA polymerase-4
VGTEHTLDHEVCSLAEFKKCMSEVTAEAVARLRRLGLGARGVTIKLRSGEFTSIARSRSLGSPTSDLSTIANAVALLAPAAFAQAHHRVRLVGVSLTGLSESVQLRLDLSGTGLVGDLDPVPAPGSRVTHRTHGGGTVAMAHPGAAIVRFDDGHVRIIENPRAHLARGTAPRHDNAPAPISR